MKKIQRALISVYTKEGLNALLVKLAKEGVELISTGGTARYIREQGYECTEVESVTGYPSILGGRVKTLHPKIAGGILARRDQEGDRQEMEKYGIKGIDLVVVDLYPFEDTVASGATSEEIIEKIDIGGITLIRAAAKNYADVAIVASRAQYSTLYEIILEHGAATTLEERRSLATKAFKVTQAYDRAIYEWFEDQN